MTVRVLGAEDLEAARAVVDTDPVVNVFADSMIEASRLLPRRGAPVWGYAEQGRLVSLCHAGGNLVPVHATPAATSAFIRFALRHGQRCFQIVGEAPVVLALWDGLDGHWPAAREIRADQPFMVMDADPTLPALTEVAPVRPDQLDVLYPAAVAMYREEVGAEPAGGPGGDFYRRRVADLIRTGCAFAWIEEGRVVFKAEVGAIGRVACQIQGVWVAPDRRGQGIAAPAMAAVVRYARRIRPVVTLYVNGYNTAARSAYGRTGFRTVTTFATVLF